MKNGLSKLGCFIIGACCSIRFNSSNASFCATVHLLGFLNIPCLKRIRRGSTTSEYFGIQRRRKLQLPTKERSFLSVLMLPTCIALMAATLDGSVETPSFETTMPHQENWVVHSSTLLALSLILYARILSNSLGRSSSICLSIVRE